MMKFLYGLRNMVVEPEPPRSRFLPGAGAAIGRVSSDSVSGFSSYQLLKNLKIVMKTQSTGIRRRINQKRPKTECAEKIWVGTGAGAAKIGRLRSPAETPSPFQDHWLNGNRALIGIEW